MPKQFAFGADARAQLKRGVDTVADAVKITIGPRGRNVVLDKKSGSPTITNDGVTIAKEIELEQPLENMGAQLIKEVASRTNDVAGDGTTTATILAQALITAGLQNVAAGANPIQLKRGIELGVDAVVAAIKGQSIAVTNRKQITQVASISAADPVLGETVADAMEKVGKDGVITVEESKSLETEIEVVKGMQFDKGYISPYMATDAQRMEAVVEEPYLLITDKKISAIADLLPILEKVVATGKPLVVIAEDVEGEALATLIVNKLRGTFTAIAIKAAGFGDGRKAVLQDIAILTGGQVISEEVGLKLDSTQLSSLGIARRVNVTKDDTTIVEGGGSADAIKGRIEQIKVEIDRSTSDWDKEKLKERLAKLSGGVAVIKVGAATETELKEKKHRMQDALSATRAAIEEGIVPGGGVCFLDAAAAVDGLSLSGDLLTGARLVRRALEEPFRQMVANAGGSASVALGRLRLMPTGYGIDLLRGETTDMVDAGIVDPTRVTVSALVNAASIAALLLTTDALIADQQQLGVSLSTRSTFGARSTESFGIGTGFVRETPSARARQEADQESAATGSVPPSSSRRVAPGRVEPGQRTRGEDVPPPSKPPVGKPPKRFLQGRFPTRVRLKARVALQVRIALEAGTGPSRELLRPVTVPPEGLDVLLVLHSPGFTPSPVQQTVSVPASSDSNWALFELDAVQPGVHTIEVTAYAGGSYLGALALQATVDAEVTTGPSADQAAPVSNRRSDPGEVSLEIRYDASARVYRYQWHSKTEVLDEKPSNPLLQTPQEAVEELVWELNRLARGRIPWTADDTEKWLKNVGIGLWDNFIPEELKKHFWESWDQITSLTILSSRLSPGDVVPWELLYPNSPANDEGFLVRKFPVARWLFGPTAVDKLRISRADFVLPDGGPASASEEVAAIKRLFGSAATDQPIRSLTDLLRIFDEAKFSLLHFACHNSFAETSADKSEVLMGGRPLRPTFLNEHAGRFKLEPLVFMNACRTDGKAPRYTRLDGWAPAFLGAGAGAFIGSLWEVVDGSSSRFAQKFYSTLLEGGTLGQSLRDAREEIRLEPGDPTWLAYTLYGNPAATLSA